MFSKASFILSRVIEIAMLVFGILALTASDLYTHANNFAAWDVLAIAYLAIRVVRVKRSRKQFDSESLDWLKGTLGPRLGTIFTLITSLFGIAAGVTIVVGKDSGDAGLWAQIAAVPAVILGWAILQFGYAERYAQTYYADPDNPILGFPNAKNPNFADFTYFAFTMGTTFAVSDVESQNTAIRMRILGHGLTAFLYNTAIVGILVGLLTG